MATPKQAAYIRSLMIMTGHAHPMYGTMRASSKQLPHSPTMRQRSGTVDAWAASLTVKQASEVIDYLDA